MRIELKTKHYIGIGLGLIILILNFIFFFGFTSPIGPKHWIFNPLIVIAVLVAVIFFILDYLDENKRQKEIESKFLEFVRGLVEIVRSGVSIPQAIILVSKSDFGALTRYTKKLANQLEWGYPLHHAFNIFAIDTKNPVIKRSVAIVIQAEKSGGDMASVLEAVTKSVLEIKKIKEERKSQSYNQMVQGYIIFFVFVAIMLVLQIFLLPKLTSISAEVMTDLSGAGFAGGAAAGEPQELNTIFIGIILVQGLFAGLMIGKFAEGNYKDGIKHSLIMIISGYLIFSTVKGIALSLFLLIPKKVIKWIRKQ